MVAVRGRAFAQPNTQIDMSVRAGIRKDRKLATGMCDEGLGFHADVLRSGIQLDVARKAVAILSSAPQAARRFAFGAFQVHNSCIPHQEAMP